MTVPGVPPSSELNEKMLQAAAEGSLSGVKRYLQAGADPLAVTASGATGAHLVARHRDYGGYNNEGRELLSLFLNRGVAVNARDAAGATPLHLSLADESYSSCKNKVEDLLAFGADLEAVDARGRTPLHYAAGGGNKNEGLKCIISRGAKINAADADGATPLHLAAQRGDMEVVKILLDAGAEAGRPDKTNRHPWDYAEAAGHEYLSQVLRAEAARQQRQAAADKTAKDPWVLLAPDKISHTTVEGKIGYRITEIFNFATRTYSRQTQNLQTKAEAVAVKTFDEFSDKALLERAHDELVRLGGTADRGVITAAPLDKPKSKGKPGLRPPSA